MPKIRRVPISVVMDGEFCTKSCPFQEMNEDADLNCRLFDQLLKCSLGRSLSQRCQACFDMEQADGSWCNER